MQEAVQFYSIVNPIHVYIVYLTSDKGEVQKTEDKRKVSLLFEKRSSAHIARSCTILQHVYPIYIFNVYLTSDKGEVKKTEDKRKVSLLFEKPLSQSIESTYCKRLFDFLYRAYELTLGQDRMLPPKQKNQVMWSVRDTTRIQVRYLCLFCQIYLIHVVKLEWVCMSL